MSAKHLEIDLAGEAFYLLPQKAIFRPLKKQLLLSDIHLGKASHFRKKGIAMPARSHANDLDKLQFLIKHWNPETVLILGDLFHSDYNKEWLWFKSFLMEYPSIQFILIEGNHDILKNNVYQLPNLIKIDMIEEADFIFTHHPLADSSKINFCGHLHPGFTIYGKAKQSEKLPCFYFYNKHFILPAFGSLTGLFMMEKITDARFYLITGKEVISYK